MANATELKIDGPSNKIAKLHAALFMAYLSNNSNALPLISKTIASLSDQEIVALANYRTKHFSDNPESPMYVSPHMYVPAHSGMQLATLIRAEHPTFFMRLAQLPLEHFAEINLQGNPNDNFYGKGDIHGRDVLNFMCEGALSHGYAILLSKVLSMPQPKFATLNFNLGSYDNEGNEEANGTILMKACRLARKTVNTHLVENEIAAKHPQYAPFGITFFLQDNHWHYHLQHYNEQHQVVKFFGKVADICTAEALRDLDNFAETVMPIEDIGLRVKDESVKKVSRRIVEHHKLSENDHRPELLQRIFELPEEAVQGLSLDLTAIPESSEMDGRTPDRIITDILKAVNENNMTKSFSEFYVKLSLEQLNFLDSVVFRKNNDGKKEMTQQFRDLNFPEQVHELALELRLLKAENKKLRQELAQAQQVRPVAASEDGDVTKEEPTASHGAFFK